MHFQSLRVLQNVILGFRHNETDVALLGYDAA